MSAKTLISALAFGVVFALPASAATVTVIDTLNTEIGTPGYATPSFALINLFGIGQNPLGQSFTLTETLENIKIEALLTSFGGTAATAGFTGTFELFAGAGVTGTALAVVEFVVLGADVVGRQIVSSVADFSAFGEFEAGTYTAAVRGDGRTNAGALLSGTPAERTGSSGLSGIIITPPVNTPGTESYGPSGLFVFSNTNVAEFGFKVTGETVQPIPLPAGGLLLITALVGMGVAARRRRA